ncbi:MAG: ABC transporter permease [Gammaproteobacteria bacterium]|nr:ABC transporter permease [Gammaproteobacteria bacterium]
MRDALLRFRGILFKEFKQLRRDRLTFGMIIGVPLLQILLFGYAIELDVRHLAAGVADQANTQVSRRYLRELEGSQVIDIIRAYPGPAALQQALDRGDINVGVFLPGDFEERRERGQPVGQLLVNGSDPTIEGIARQLSNAPLPGDSQPPSRLVTRTFYNPERRSEVQIVPGLIGVILNLTMVLFTAVAIVRERERGNLELLITTPVKTGELMLGKLVPYILIGLVQVTIILLVGKWLFEVPMRGSLVDLYLASGLFIAATLSLGLLISTLAKTQFQAMQLTVFTFLPAILLSGFMFPFEGMPKIAQWIAEVIPLTHFVRLVRGILLRAASLDSFALELSALTAFTLAMLLATRLRFHKRLD